MKGRIEEIPDDADYDYNQPNYGESCNHEMQGGALIGGAMLGGCRNCPMCGGVLKAKSIFEKVNKKTILPKKLTKKQLKEMINYAKSSGDKKTLKQLKTQLKNIEDGKEVKLKKLRGTGEPYYAADKTKPVKKKMTKQQFLNFVKNNPEMFKGLKYKPGKKINSLNTSRKVNKKGIPSGECKYGTMSNGRKYFMIDGKFVSEEMFYYLCSKRNITPKKMPAKKTPAKKTPAKKKDSETIKKGDLTLINKKLKKKNKKFNDLAELDYEDNELATREAEELYEIYKKNPHSKLDLEMLTGIDVYNKKGQPSYKYDMDQMDEAYEFEEQQKYQDLAAIIESIMQLENLKDRELTDIDILDEAYDIYKNLSDIEPDFPDEGEGEEEQYDFSGLTQNAKQLFF